MTEQYFIIHVPSDAPEVAEAMGTKEKFWFRDYKQRLCLFKKTRVNTGEDWSEKIAAELRHLLGLPHANYELATFNGERGVISPSFVPKNGELITGNEILAQNWPDYPRDILDPSQHTLNNIFQIFDITSVKLPFNWQPPAGIETAVDTFIGYLLLDTWIGNTDRHHENWGFIHLGERTYLAPTYDHASSLGQNESDEKRKQRLNTADKNFSVKAYVKKCRSCIYAKVNNTKPLTTFDVFYQALQHYPQAAYIWLDFLEKIATTDTRELFERIPHERISLTAIDFAQRILEINQNRLLALRNT